MNAKQRYRIFLKSKFWVRLSGMAKLKAGRCERCGSKKELESHHWRYRSDWYETRLDDLEVLCGKCHRKEHGMGRRYFMAFREDEVFNAMVHRCSCLIRKLTNGKALIGLRSRDEAFLAKAMRKYPATATDGCVAFNVANVMRFSDLKPKERL